MVFSAYKKKTDIGVIEEDKRGTTKCVQIPDEKGIREHIRSFPQTESHYCRKQSRRNYLSAELNLGKLNDLYGNEKKEKSLNFVSKSSYKKIFYTVFNMGFFKRSKVRCDFCTM